MLISESTENYKINSSITESSDKLFRVSLAPNGKTIEEVIASGENYDLKYIISNKIPGPFHPITDTLYDNYEQYPYLKKIFDSSNQGFKKLKIKVFEISYEEFNRQLNE